ncbi:hypothetical protein Tco_1012967, partial [Tanacetum coccineum]
MSEVFATLRKTWENYQEYDAIVSKLRNLIRPKVVVFSVVYDGVQRMDENRSSDLVKMEQGSLGVVEHHEDEFTKLILSWSLDDILNEDLYKNK